MAKKLAKKQGGGPIKKIVSAVVKATKPVITNTEIKKAVTLTERDHLRERFKALDKKQVGGQAVDKYTARRDSIANARSKATKAELDSMSKPTYKAPTEKGESKQFARIKITKLKSGGSTKSKK